MDLGWVLKPNEKLYQSLSRYERYLLSLVYEQHLPMVRVAAKLQRDKDTIKRHLKAALRKLKDRITDAAET